MRRLRHPLAVLLAALVLLPAAPASARTLLAAGHGTVVAAPGIQPAPHLGVVAAASATGVTHTTRTLSLQALGDIAIDPTHQHVFITGNPNLTNDSILVTDYSGAEVTTISGESGAAGMVVDGSTLYVARCGATSGIDVFDTDTLTKTGSITATVADGRCDLALSGGRLWFVSDASGTLASVTIATPHVTAGHGTGYTNSTFATAAGNPHLLFAGTQFGSPSVVSEIDTSGGDFSVVKSVFGLGGMSDLGGLSLPDDASVLYAASAANTGAPTPYSGQAFAVPGLADAGSYPVGTYPRGIAVPADGSFVAVGAMGIYDPDVFVFAADSQTPNWTYDFGNPNEAVAVDGIRFTPDGSTLFVVSYDDDAGTTRLTVFHDPTMVPGALGLSLGRSQVTYGTAVTITAQLSTASTNRKVSIFAKPLGGSRKLVASGNVDANGNFAASVKPSKLTTYTAEWSGDASHFTTDSAQYAVGVHVRMLSAISRGYAKRGLYHLYHYRSSCPTVGRECIGYATQVLPNHGGKKVTFVLQHYRRGWRNVGTLTVKLNRRSAAGIVFRYGPRSIGVKYRLAAKFAGDADHLNGVTRWTYFQVTR